MSKNRRFIEEWAIQSAVMIAWPHEDTDWKYMLDEVEACYINVANTILKYEDLIIITQKEEHVRSLIGDKHKFNVSYVNIPTNDTWCRDFGAITINNGNRIAICDFKFNAWGNKFNWELDNSVTPEMINKNLFSCEKINCQDFILEGGSVETDGKGTLLVTSQCLLTPTRNPHMNKAEIESYLCTTLGVKKVLWLDYGAFQGDDTDSHIDTLARIGPNNSIVYAGCEDENDAHFNELNKMEQQLSTFTDVDNIPYKLYKLPFPTPIYDEEGERLPATYANYIIVNDAVLVPTYNQPDNDARALAVIQKAFPNHEIVGVNCNALIKQHGSLHCITMQFPKNVFNNI
jgi:agmatine/peptidylarginine deiminase